MIAWWRLRRCSKKLVGVAEASLLSKALSEVGRLERTLFMIEYYSDPGLRRRCLGGLNKGEAAHKLKRSVFFHESGEIRDRSFLLSKGGVYRPPAQMAAVI